MAKELDVFDEAAILVKEPEKFAHEGHAVSLSALDEAGGYEGLAMRFPFDRGDANKSLVLLCLELADALTPGDQQTADRLRSAAIRVGSNVAYSGSPRHEFRDTQLLEAIRTAWRAAGPDTRESERVGALTASIGLMLGKLRILFVSANPRDEDQIRVNEELRVVQEAIRLSSGRDIIELTSLVAATADDLRRELLRSTYEVLHLAGHGDGDSFVMHGADGNGVALSLESLGAMIARHPTVKCVILNSCDSAVALRGAIGPLTVAMHDTITDEAAVEFSRGFYDAVGAGKPFEYAVGEGLTAAKVKGLEPPITVLKTNGP